MSDKELMRLAAKAKSVEGKFASLIRLEKKFVSELQAIKGNLNMLTKKFDAYEKEFKQHITVLRLDVNKLT